MCSDFAHQKITAASIAALLRASGFSMTWLDLKAEFVDRAGRQARELKQVLRGMLRNGDLEQDEAAGTWWKRRNWSKA